VERIIEQVVEVVKEVPIEKVVERIQIKEIPVVETEERVVEVVREIPVEIVKEVPVYIKVDPTEWDSRHNLRSSTVAQSYPSGNYTQAQAMVTHQTAYSGTAVGIGGVGMRLACYANTGTQPYVCEIVPNSPAADSRQVAIEDRVTHVDQQDVTSMSLDRINSLIRGPVGTNVLINLVDKGGQPKTVTLTRRAYGT
jgi:C-terminal processing protease CtpA/Prc